MANKQVNELTTVTGVLDQNDYLIVYDSDESGSEKLKKRPVSDYVATINSDLTLYVSTTGSDSTGDGTSGNPFASVQNGALKYLANKIIDPDYTVTIQVAAGTYTEPPTMNDTYPFIHLVRIEGDYDNSLSVTSIQSSSGSSGAWSVVLNVSDASGIDTGDYVNITNCSNITNAEYVGGCWEVTDVDSGNSRITVANKHITSSFPSGSLNADLTVLKTIFDGNSTIADGAYVYNNNKFYVTGIAFINYTDTGVEAQYASSTSIVNCGFNNCKHGVKVYTYSYGFVQNIASSNCTTSSMLINTGGGVVCGGNNNVFSATASHGVFVGYRSFLNATTITSTGNSGNGILITVNSTIRLTGGGTSTGNTSDGLDVTEGSVAQCDSNSRFDNNGAYGVECTYDSFVKLLSASTTGNTSGATNTANGGNIYT